MDAPQDKLSRGRDSDSSAGVGASARTEFPRSAEKVGSSPTADTTNSVHDLETEKLRVEIEEARLRIRTQSAQGPKDFAKSFLTYLGVITPLVLGGWAAIVQWREHEERLQRKARFDVGSEIVQISNQLSSASSRDARLLAAPQLAWFGRAAIYILFENLMVEESDTVRDAILLALADIAKSDHEEGVVMALLTESTATYATFVLRRKHSNNATLERNVPALKKRLSALSEVALALRADRERRVSAGEKPSTQYLKRTDTALEGISDEIERLPEGPDKTFLLELIDETRSRVSG